MNETPNRPHFPDHHTFRIGDRVQKRSGGSWRGTIVGWYRTAMTPEGYAVESAFEPGSVQIYPAPALEPWQPTTENS